MATACRTGKARWRNCNTASEMPPRSMWEDRLATAREKGIKIPLTGPQDERG